MASNIPFRRLRIAITGGGLAGATLANALFDQPHLDIHLFESAPEYSERGAAVGLAVNAQRALAEIIPSANELLHKAGAVPMNSTRVVIVCTFHPFFILPSVLNNNNNNMSVWVYTAG